MTATPQMVRDINGSTADDTIIAPFIVAAECVLVQVINNGCWVPSSVECRDMVQAYIAAHLMAQAGAGQANTPIVKIKERFEAWSVETANAAASGEGIMATQYGATANMMTNGCLVKLNKGNATVCFA